MDIHKPKPTHNWREFISEIGVVVIGVLIALAGEQLVNSLHWRTEVYEFRDAADKELASDLAAFEFRVKQAPCVSRRIAELESLLTSARAGTPVPLLEDIGRPANITLRTSVWDTRAGELMSHIPIEKRLAYSSLYDELANNDRQIVEERDVWKSLSQFNGASAFSSDNLMRLSELIYRAKTINKIVTSNSREVSNLASALGIRPDFGERYIAPPDPHFCSPLLPARAS
ncbi:hypothetical protein SPAN111604_00260 [Sphingomonas antarctica]